MAIIEQVPRCSEAATFPEVEHDYLTTVRSLFERISNRFSSLEFQIKDSNLPPVVDLELNFPEQQVLPFPVNAQLQDDLLALSIGYWFHAEWFPVRDRQVRASFTNALESILSGRARVVEHCRKGAGYKATLQVSLGEKWKTVARWSRLRLPSLSKTNVTVLQRKRASE